MILRVMIVEDEDMIRNGLVKTLPWADMGCTVIGSAGDGKSGLEQIIERRPDVVITDIRMPEMDGLEAARSIRALDRADAKKVPIVAMSANAFDEDVKASLAAGMNEHLSKPIDSQILYTALSEQIARARGTAQ